MLLQILLKAWKSLVFLLTQTPIHGQERAGAQDGFGPAAASATFAPFHRLPLLRPQRRIESFCFIFLTPEFWTSGLASQPTPKERLHDIPWRVHDRWL